MKRTSSAFFALIIAVASLMSTSGTAYASGGLILSEFAVHPYASNTGYNPGQRSCPATNTTFCPVGQTISDMGLTRDGKIVGGYGEWNANIDSNGRSEGGVYVAPIDANTGQWDGTAFRVGSEAMDTISEVGGDIYISQTDPSNQAPSGGYAAGDTGIVTNKGGSWRFIPMGKAFADNSGPTLEHMYDVTSLDGGDKDLWVFGAHCFEWWSGCNSDEAVAIRSTDGGATWSFAMKDNSAPTSTYGYERAYWGREVNGKIYTQARGVTPATPLHIYNGATESWSDWGTSDQYICNAWAGKSVVSFDNHLVCGEGSGSLMAFDGSTPRTITFATNGGWVSDFYAAADGYLYVLDSNQSMYRTDSLSKPFTYLGKAGIADGASSILVTGDYVYVGSQYGKIYRSNTTIASMPGFVPEITSVTPTTINLDGKPKTMRIYGKDFDAGATVKIDGVTMRVTRNDGVSLTIQVDTSKLSIDSVKTQATPTTTTQKKTVDIIVTNPGGQSVTATSAVTLQNITVTDTTPTPNQPPTGASNPTAPPVSVPGNSSAQPPMAHPTISLNSLATRLAATGVSVPTTVIIGGVAFVGGLIAIAVVRVRNPFKKRIRF